MLGFDGGARKIENMVKINAWAIDIDKGTKEEQKMRIEKSPLPASSVVETKNGYHVYWLAREATKSNFGVIQQRLVNFFGADNRAKDLARILRLPCMYHWKDPDDPFLVKEVYWNTRAYSEDKMLRVFKCREKKMAKRIYEPRDVTLGGDCVEGLKLLSGKSCVNGDEFTFKHNANGTHQIWANGKSTSCWIDENGKIGSHDKGGPTLIQWLKWYSYPTKDAIKILKDNNVWKDV